MKRKSVTLSVATAVIVGIVLLLIWLNRADDTALLEVENRSGRALERILVLQSGAERAWPGVPDGQSALLQLDTEPQGPVVVRLPLEGAPRGGAAMVSVPSLETAQRLYVRLGPQGRLAVQVFENRARPLAGPLEDN